jgi:hypothetical protein
VDCAFPQRGEVGRGEATPQNPPHHDKSHSLKKSTPSRQKLKFSSFLARARAAMSPNLDLNAVRYVYTQGQKDGCEHLYVYDEKTGKVYPQQTDHDPNQVVPAKRIQKRLMDKNAALVMTHNHPSSSSLSVKDLRMIAQPGGKRVVAVGQEGAIFSAERGIQIAHLDKAVAAGTSALRDQLRLAALRGLHLDGWWAHLLNMALDRSGVIRYRAQLDAMRQNLYIAEQKAIDTMINEIVFAIRRTLP